MLQAAKAGSALVVVVGAVLLLAGVSPAQAQAEPGGVRLEATVDTKAFGASTEARPIRLSPRRQATLSVKVTNDTTKAIDVRIVRLEGKVVGLTFFAYDTAVGLRVAPGETGSRRFLLDLGGLDGQATGLIPGAVKLLDPDRQVIAEQRGVVDVRGSLVSVYGLFGLGVAFLTVLSFLGALIGLARHRLPPNRWRRALRFMTAGLGLGLLINFTLSATRVFVPTPGRWLTIVVVSAAVLFGLGYLTPTPDTGEDEEEDERVALPVAAAKPGLPAPPPPELAPTGVVTAPRAEAALPAPGEPALPAPPPRPELAAPDNVPASADEVTSVPAPPTIAPPPPPAPDTPAPPTIAPPPAPAPDTHAPPTIAPAPTPAPETLETPPDASADGDQTDPDADDPEAGAPRPAPATVVAPPVPPAGP